MIFLLPHLDNRMSDENSDRETVGESLLQQFRQKTIIGIPRLGDDDGGKIQVDGFFIDKNSEEKLPSPSPQPTSSCLALRHAVSALTCIDDFVLEELGSGFFANVYKATHRVTGEEMVMKINKDHANRLGALREIQLMNRLSHPNILKFLGVCVHEGQLHALTEFISGGTLEALLANRAEELPWILRIKLSLDISEGLHYLHSQAVFHRDLTSRNILIKKGENRNYQAVIADFGLATQIPDPGSTEPLPPVGCPWWMAPEVIHGQFYDERADVFSLGIILLEITARIEADPETMPRTKNFGVDYVKICDLVDYCPLDFLQLAFKCCQILPERRPSSAVIRPTLEKIYKSLSLQNDTVSSSERLRKRSKSEDNIIQMSDSFTDIQDEIYMTPQIVAQAMTKDDPHYCPATVNPFADISKFKDGRKLHGIPPRKSSGNSCSQGSCGDLLSLSQVSDCWRQQQRSQSLPCSPVLLRKAAERLHLASILGSEVVQAEHQHDLHISISSDNQTDAESPAVVDRRTQFHNSRTRSLGSLDFWSSRYTPGVGGRSRGSKCRFYPNLSETGYGDKFRAEATNSYYEGEILSEFSSCMDDLIHEDVFHSAFDFSVNHCLADDSHEILPSEVEVLGCSVSRGRCEDSPSASNLPVLFSCGGIVEEEDTLEISPESTESQNHKLQNNKPLNEASDNELQTNKTSNNDLQNNEPQHKASNNELKNNESQYKA
ncbi:unnamed protein product [Candidula unifasciata]|uniref:dual-specificity kinase n=1 Tax=Candidula unifasciata TaxID=100452 RepID=A0A8S4A961_9EUPU|nr:unnamed protein product [Candidula unifasciata]